MSKSRNRKLEEQKIQLKNRLKKCKDLVEIEDIKEQIASISMEQFKIHKNWNKKDDCEYEEN